MRVRISKSIEVDIDEDVTVTVEQIADALSEELQHATGESSWEGSSHILVNSVYQCLLAMEKKGFADSCSEKNRNMIAEALEAVARRFREGFTP